MRPATSSTPRQTAAPSHVPPGASLSGSPTTRTASTRSSQPVSLTASVKRGATTEAEPHHAASTITSSPAALVQNTTTPTSTDGVCLSRHRAQQSSPADTDTALPPPLITLAVHGATDTQDTSATGTSLNPRMSHPVDAALAVSDHNKIHEGTHKSALRSPTAALASRATPQQPVPVTLPGGEHTFQHATHSPSEGGHASISSPPYARATHPFNGRIASPSHHHQAGELSPSSSSRDSAGDHSQFFAADPSPSRAPAVNADTHRTDMCTPTSATSLPLQTPDHHHHHHHPATQQHSGYGSSVATAAYGDVASPAPVPANAIVGRGRGGGVNRTTVPTQLPSTRSSHVDAVANSSSNESSFTRAEATTASPTGLHPVARFMPHHHHHHHHTMSTHGAMPSSSPPGPRTGPMPSASPPPQASGPAAGAHYSSHMPMQGLLFQPMLGYAGQPQQAPQHHHYNGVSGGCGSGGYGSTGSTAATPTAAAAPQREANGFAGEPPAGDAGGRRAEYPGGPTRGGGWSVPQPGEVADGEPFVGGPSPTNVTVRSCMSPAPLSAASATGSLNGPYYSPSPSYGHQSPAQPSVTGSTGPAAGGPRRGEDGQLDHVNVAAGSATGAPLPVRYVSPPPSHAGSPNSACPTAGPAVPTSCLVYDHQVNNELWVEDRKAELPFNADVYGNIACLVSAISPQVAVAHELEIPAQCTPNFDNGTGLSGPVVQTHPSTPSASDDTHLQGTDAPTTTSDLNAAPHDSACEAVGHYRYYRAFGGPSFSEPVVRLRDVWEGFDSPFGYVVHLAQPVQLAGMKPPEDQVVYEPLLSGFRVGFHDAAPAYHHLAALRGVHTDRFTEQQPEAADSDTTDASARFSAVDVGVISWSAAERPDSRHVVARQIQELARADPLFAPLLTATSADVDHRSWVAILWQPVFIGGHSPKHSCGSFLAYYMLRPPRHLFMPFAERSYGAAMNSAWDSPAFRADRAVINFDIWSFQRDYDVGRPVLPPTDETLPSHKASSSSAHGRTAEAASAGDREAPPSPPMASPVNATPLSSVVASARDGAGGATHTTASRRGLPSDTTGAASPFICIPVVGLVPSRCRSEAWFTTNDYPIDPQLLPSRQAAKNRSGQGVAGSGTGTSTASPSAVGGPGGATATTAAASGYVNAAGAHSKDAHHVPTRPQDMVWAYRVPLFFLASALQLMCWNAYEEHVRRRRRLDFLTGKAAAFATAAAATAEAGADHDTSSPTETQAADASASDTDGSPSAPASTPPTASGLAARRTSALPPPLQAEAVVKALELSATGTTSNDTTAHLIEGEEEEDEEEEVPYYPCAVRLMNRSAQTYREVREESHIDQAMEEATSNTHTRGGGGHRQQPEENRVCPLAVVGGCSTTIEAASRLPTEKTCGAALSTIVGLLDFYRWARFDTSLQEFAQNYCQS